MKKKSLFFVPYVINEKPIKSQCPKLIYLNPKQIFLPCQYFIKVFKPNHDYERFDDQYFLVFGELNLKYYFHAYAKANHVNAIFVN